MMYDPLFRPGSHCQIYGHTWQAMSTPGHSQCSLCKKPAYCPECAHTIPLGALRVRCSHHTTRPSERRPAPNAE